MGMTLQAPVLLTATHHCVGFTCGDDLMDAWLTRRALPNQISGATRTYVLCDSSDVVLGYYSLATGAVVASSATGRLRRNMPDPIPVVILARLAVAESVQGQGLGTDLVVDALKRVLTAANIVGVRGLVVHALHEGLGLFYSKLGFSVSPVDPQLYMVTLADVRAALQTIQ